MAPIQGTFFAFSLAWLYSLRLQRPMKITDYLKTFQEEMRKEKGFWGMRSKGARKLRPWNQTTPFFFLLRKYRSKDGFRNYMVL